LGVDVQTPKGDTPLHLAACTGRVETVIMMRSRCAAGLTGALGPSNTVTTELGGATATQRVTDVYDGLPPNPLNPNRSRGPERGRMDTEPHGSRAGRGGQGNKRRGRHGAGKAAGPRTGGEAVNFQHLARKREADGKGEGGRREGAEHEGSVQEGSRVDGHEGQSTLRNTKTKRAKGKGRGDG
jgi:hypothetical protein